MLVRIQRKKKPYVCWWESKLAQPLWKTVWRFLRKIKKRATLWSSNSTSRYLSEENENTNLKRYICNLMFSFTTARTWKQPKYPSIDEWKKKMCSLSIHTHTHTHRNIHIKRRKSCHLWKHEWILTALCQVRLVKQRKTNYVF